MKPPENLLPAVDSRNNGMVSVRGAREHNLKNVNVDIPRDALVVFTGVSGSGKSSLAFGTLYAEAQRRYLESVSPYARRLFHQMEVPEVDSIAGLPPAVALQQHRGSPTTRSSVGSVTTLSNLFRMLYSRAGDYPPGQPLLYAESFSTNTAEGACPQCHGLGRVYEVTEQSMVPDPSLTIRERAVAAWPTAWQGQNLRDILVTLGYDVDKPWKDLSRKDRDWILFTEEQPTVPVYAGFTPAETRTALRRKMEPSYQGTFTGAKRYVLSTFANTTSAMMKRRVARFMLSAECPLCHGKRLKKEALSVMFAGLDIAEMANLPAKKLQEVMLASMTRKGKTSIEAHPEKQTARQRMTHEIVARLGVLMELGLGYLSLDAHAFAGRVAAPSAGNATPFQSLRRRLRARRTDGRPPSRRHRSSAHGARCAETRRQFSVRGRARTRGDAEGRLAGRCGPGGRAERWPCAL
jgi:excinuclease ABC subunit A